MFLFARVLPLVRISAILEFIWVSKGLKTFQNRPFHMDAELVRKTLKTFNLTTTNDILMKLITIIYLHESINLKPLRARNEVP